MRILPRCVGPGVEGVMSQLRCLWAPLPGSLKGAEGGEKKTVREQHRGTGDSRAHSPSSWGLDTQNTQKKGKKRFYRDLNPGRKIQSLEC